MRERPTPAEQALWEAICSISAHEGWEIDRQVIIRGYIVDILIRNKNLAIEVDGDYHDRERQLEIDAYRDSVLNGYGLRVHRLKNEYVMADTAAAADSVREFVDSVAPLYYPRDLAYKSHKKAERELCGNYGAVKAQNP